MKKNDLEKNRRAIRNSTVDFLIFTKDASEDSIEVRVQDGEVWLTQDGIAQLFEPFVKVFGAFDDVHV